jgi:hypothetical protein
MSTRVSMPDRRQYSTPLRCASCDAQGDARWEETGGDAPTRILIALAGPFHSEPARTRSGNAMIVCSRCDEIQPD